MGLDFIPKLISYDIKGILEIELIDGVRIIDMDKPDFVAIAAMLDKFHQVQNIENKVLCHIDNNPRNYLYDRLHDKFLMIDFSDSRVDYPEWDVIGFLLFWASIVNRIRFKEIVKEFLTGYTISRLEDEKRFEYIYHQNIFIFDERRKKYNKQESLNNPDVIDNRKSILELYHRILHKEEM
ncbi:MAG TPA: phosphotransferase [Candidatus Cloacimonadota bacterium]|nr:phosphotransferase [Candidatus Cloacimonadota bacterium]HPT72972.1 phosphotransferase [Candidatus Cloacimonadota bacterium]